jgi:plastocyanin
MKAIPALATALVVLAVGQAASASPAPEDVATASRTANVGIVNFAFRPGTLNVSKGTKVVFNNNSTNFHTATRSGSFDTKRIEPGGSVSVRFGQKGTFRYHCKIHSEMRAKVVVG